jgi:hypothetical protein
VSWNARGGANRHAVFEHTIYNSASLAVDADSEALRITTNVHIVRLSGILLCRPLHISSELHGRAGWSSCAAILADRLCVGGVQVSTPKAEGPKSSIKIITHPKRKNQAASNFPTGNDSLHSAPNISILKNACPLAISSTLTRRSASGPSTTSTVSPT